MALYGLNRISVRPRGGVAKVELIPASATAAANFATLNHDARVASIAQAVGASAWAFREDRARYSEEQVSAGTLVPMVKHTLEMEFPATGESRRAVDELMATAATEGIVAVVTMASGEVVVAGYSSRFAAAYPLRVAKRGAASGFSPADFPVITLILESIDADPSSSIGV